MTTTRKLVITLAATAVLSACQSKSGGGNGDPNANIVTAKGTTEMTGSFKSYAVIDAANAFPKANSCSEYSRKLDPRVKEGSWYASDYLEQDYSGEVTKRAVLKVSIKNLKSSSQKFDRDTELLSSAGTLKSGQKQTDNCSLSYYGSLRCYRDYKTSDLSGLSSPKGTVCSMYVASTQATVIEMGLFSMANGTKVRAQKVTTTKAGQLRCVRYVENSSTQEEAGSWTLPGTETTELITTDERPVFDAYCDGQEDSGVFSRKVIKADGGAILSVTRTEVTDGDF